MHDNIRLFKFYFRDNNVQMKFKLCDMKTFKRKKDINENGLRRFERINYYSNVITSIFWIE